MPNTGEKPGIGSYKCIFCKKVLKLDENTDKLPPCPNCNNTSYNKV